MPVRKSDDLHYDCPHIKAFGTSVAVHIISTPQLTGRRSATRAEGTPQQSDATLWGSPVEHRVGYT
jgi:hypothetical protein